MTGLNSDVASKGVSWIEAKEYQRAFELFIQYSNEPLAQFHLGEIFYNDDTHLDHLELSFEWFRKSALGGYKRRLYLMTVCGYSGGKLERLLR
jgi:hypothetical protein